MKSDDIDERECSVGMEFDEVGQSGTWPNEVRPALKESSKTRALEQFTKGWQPDPKKVTRFTPHYRQAPSRPGVYMFHAVGSGLVKIGYSECVAQRIQGGLTGPGGESLGYLADLRGGPEVEKFWHRVFAHRNARIPGKREWFYFGDGMFDLVRAARADWSMTREWCATELALDEEFYPPLVAYVQRHGL